MAFVRGYGEAMLTRCRLALALALTACNVPVAGALDEDDANRIVLALDRSNIDSTKEVDPTVEGKVRVVGARGARRSAARARRTDRGRARIGSHASDHARRARRPRRGSRARGAHALDSSRSRACRAREMSGPRPATRRP